MTTAIAEWGNSAAIRIPKVILTRAGLKLGDRISLNVNERGCIEVVPQASSHRHVKAAHGVTAQTLFATYGGGRYDASEAWPSEDLMGAEKEAWS